MWLVRCSLRGLADGELVTDGEQQGEVVAQGHFLVDAFVEGKCVGHFGYGHATQVHLKHDGEVLVLVAKSEEEAGIDAFNDIEYGLGFAVVPFGLGQASGDFGVVEGAEETYIDCRAKRHEDVVAGLANGQFVG